MRILGHIHSFNDEDVIDRSIQALLDQTRPVDEIVVVDNGSADGTCAKLAAKPVTVLRHAKNLGTSGAVLTGMRYALEHGYEWIWIFDADSAPRPNALEELLGLYRNLPPERQEQVWLLSSLHVDAGRGEPEIYEMVFTPDGFRPVRPEPGAKSCEFDSTIWSGCLYKLDGVAAVGLPSADYVLDWGEHEYGYRGRRAGYRALLQPQSVVEHNVRGEAALHFTSYRFGPVVFRMRELSPIRCYYFCRNAVYFWLYVYHSRDPRAVIVQMLRVAKFTMCFAVRAATRWAQLVACVRGIRDGFARRMERRY
jgi:rhamnosyltransferase